MTPNNVLISVYHKERLPQLAEALSTLSVNIFSTGGTARALEALGVEVTFIEELTQSPPMLGGRVKTLHPKVFGGILARRDREDDRADVARAQLPLFDWVIVDLYPFVESMRAQADHAQLIEHIDIGGVSLIRAAAKNYLHTLIVPSEAQFDDLIELIHDRGGYTDASTRRRFAARAFTLTTRYDQEIARFLDAPLLTPAYDALPAPPQAPPPQTRTLRYGENPHQRAQFTGDFSQHFTQLNGPELSYNNLIDLDAAVQLITEFDRPTCAILKHTNPCGLASRDDLVQAYTAALSCDPTSAFGGVIVSNVEVDLETAELIGALFYAVLAAPSYTPEALEVLTQRKGRVILQLCDDITLSSGLPRPTMQRSLFSGVLVQEMDRNLEEPERWCSVTSSRPNVSETADLGFALRAVKHLKSNAIALVKDAQLIGMGCGQPSRIDALNQAIDKARRYGFDLDGAVMASDAFFPFPDCVTRSADMGIRAIIQPGGSRRDQESIDVADELGVAMVMTGVRHFKH